jgi:tRNA nucleotidyltransferase (CCA-adding enzyme)
MEKAFEILKKINGQGFSAYIVGGSVRDHIMNKKPVDIDITTDALPDDIKKIFTYTIDTGIAHGTVTVIEDDDKYEITTFRTDGKYSDGRRPADVRFIDDLKTDLSRRDFTINAMALDADGNLIDPFNGRIHISEKKIKAIGDPDIRFTEDALRMMRAVRFACQLGFSIEPVTLASIRRNRKKINNVSTERITSEIIKMVNSKHVELISYLYKTKIINELDGHATLCDANILKRIPPRYNYRLYAFMNLASIGTKSLSLSKSNLEYYSYYFMPIENNRMFLKDLLRRYDLELIIKILFFRSYYEDSDYYLSAIEQIRDIIKYHEPYMLSQLALNGNDLINLGMTNGPEIGKTLNSLLDLVMLHPDMNVKEKLIIGTSLLK